MSHENVEHQALALVVRATAAQRLGIGEILELAAQVAADAGADPARLPDALAARLATRAKSA